MKDLKDPLRFGGIGVFSSEWICPAGGSSVFVSLVEILESRDRAGLCDLLCSVALHGIVLCHWMHLSVGAVMHNGAQRGQCAIIGLNGSMGAMIIMGSMGSTGAMITMGSLGIMGAMGTIGSMWSMGGNERNGAMCSMESMMHNGAQWGIGQNGLNGFEGGQ